MNKGSPISPLRSEVSGNGDSQSGPSEEERERISSESFSRILEETVSDLFVCLFCSHSDAVWMCSVLYLFHVNVLCIVCSYITVQQGLPLKPVLTYYSLTFPVHLVFSILCIE